MSEFVVYTAMSAGYDRLNVVPEYWRGKARFVAFLDKPQSDLGWEVQPLPQKFSDPCRNAKIPKILPHLFFPKARFSLWVDGSLQITSDLSVERWAAKFLNHHDIALFPNHHFQCIYREARMCLQAGLDYPEVIHQHMQRYFDEGYPLNNGLVDCGVLFRRHTAKIRRFDEMWQNEIVTGSRRDQLSFNYVAYKLGVKYRLLPGNYFRNDHFKWRSHLKPREWLGRPVGLMPIPAVKTPRASLLK